MNSDYILGVCFDNKDPDYKGRIRAIPLYILPKQANLSGILDYINNLDINAEKQLQYQPWKTTKFQNYTSYDKYTCEPFLPKNVGLIPLPGQLVKIINPNSTESIQEYIGPYTVDQIHLKEEYRNVVANLNKDINLKEVVPSTNKISISGYNNEQILIGDNEMIFRLNYIDNDKKRKLNYPFIQLSQYNSSFTTSEENVNVSETIDSLIDYVACCFLSYTDKKLNDEQNFTATILLFDGSKIKDKNNKFGLLLRTFDINNPYFDINNKDFVTKYIIKTNNTNELTKYIDESIQCFKNKTLLKYYDIKNTNTIQEYKTNTTTITIMNNLSSIPNIGGGTNDINTIDNIKNWVFMLSPITPIQDIKEPNMKINNIERIQYTDKIGFNNIIDLYRQIKTFGNLNNKRTYTEKRKVIKNNPESKSSCITHADEYLFLTNNTINTKKIKDYDGVSTIKYAEFRENSYGSIRGEKLMELLNELIDILKTHGHEIGVDPRSSIISSTQSRLNTLKQKLSDEINSKNNTIINHKFRID